MPAPITTEVTICNSALFKCGADKIQSLTQDTRAAIVCNTLFAYLRDEALSAHRWKFALKRTTLNPTETTPDWGYDYEYDVPSDCLRALELEDKSVIWTQEGDKFLSDAEELPMLYIYRNVNPSDWSSLFAETLAWRLAMELSLSLTKSTALHNLAAKAYENNLTQARAMNGMIGTLPPLEADIWTGSRRSSSFDPQRA
jgi:hypothetical protein